MNTGRECGAAGGEANCRLHESATLRLSGASTGRPPGCSSVVGVGLVRITTDDFSGRMPLKQAAGPDMITEDVVGLVAVEPLQLGGMSPAIYWGCHR